MTGLDEATDPRQSELLRAFQENLKRALAEEAAPSGLADEILAELQVGMREPPAQSVDRYHLWSSLTVLSQEVKLQGRSFRELRDVVEPIAELESRLEQTAEISQSTCNEVRRLARRLDEANLADSGTLALLLDLRDRLRRNLDACSARLAKARSAQQSWLRRLFGGAANAEAVAAVEALHGGVRLAFERIDTTLCDMGVAEIDCRGQLFDPQCMRAVDLVETEELLDGTVLDVVRPGYLQHGETLRLAEVKVARRPVGRKEENHVP
jgi:molecular chaperone GrpE